MKKFILFSLILTAMVAGCKNSATTDSDTSSIEAPIEFSLTEIWRTDTVLTTCESVLYDPVLEAIFVSCINGGPAEKDGNGFISMMSAEGEISSLEWVGGLDAPKGMAIYQGKLYVTDIDKVIIIDIESSQILDRISVEGASFLNDISIDKNGIAYFSDSDTGIIWVYTDGELKQWISEGLNRPNGLFVEKDRILLTSSGSEDLKSIDKKSVEATVLTTEIGHGDGVEFTGKEGYYLTSSWAGEVFLIYPDFSKKSLLKTSDQQINSADIGFNIEDQIVYIPTFFANNVVAYKLKQK